MKKLIHHPPASQPLGAGHSLAERFQAVRAQTLALVAPLSAEDCALQSMPDASPVKWHLAHTTWFFETFILERWEKHFRPFQSMFRYLFNSYYNAVGDKYPRPQRGLISRPALSEILMYRKHVDSRLAELMPLAESDAEFATLLELGINHEQQHQELILTDLKHLLAQNPLKPVYREGWPLVTVAPQRMQWLAVAGGTPQVGHDGKGFAFDNEAPRHTVFVQPFEIATRLVTHGEWRDFIEDGGYARPELWLSAGWDAVQNERWQAPLYWENRDGAWHTFTLHGMVPIEPNTPVCHVSHYEADAFARWAGARLATEFEWEAASAHADSDRNMLESGALHPLALRKPPKSGALAQMFGDVWEWTQSAYLPYPGFKTAAGAVGEYNGKFMNNQMVLRGGSCVTPQSHIRATYRNFFPSHARWQFSGVRLARDI